MRREMIELSSERGSECQGYLTSPRDGPGPGVVVVQEFWGLVDQIKGVADRLAEAGFTALVPDLYDGVVTADRDEAMRLMQSLDVDEAVRRVHDAIATVRQHSSDPSRVACMGFCMGGGLALLMASREKDLTAAVVYYGGLPWCDMDLRWEESGAAVLMHYASEDEWATPDFGRQTSQALRAKGRTVEFHLYEGSKHAFLDETRPESHDPAATELSWARTLAFLRRLIDGNDPISTTEVD